MAKTKRGGTRSTKVSTGIIDPQGKPIEESFDTDPKTMESNVNKKKDLLKNLKKEALNEDADYPAWIISRLPQSCPISYLGETIMVPARCPKGKLLVKNSRMLGKLPKGVRTVPAPEKMQKKRIK
jgi:hypothetical protein